MRLSDSEWKIADCLWNNGDMTITELTKELRPVTGWSKNTIITMLKRMTEKVQSTGLKQNLKRQNLSSIKSIRVMSAS